MGCSSAIRQCRALTGKTPHLLLLAAQRVETPHFLEGLNR